MMSFQREYAESYDWLDENERSLYRQGMLVFGGVAPTYHTELRERPNLVWDFNSLLLCILLSTDQMAELFQRDRSVIGIHEKRVIFSQEADN